MSAPPCTDEIGGKAFTLFGLHRAGYRVPDFEVLTIGSRDLRETVGRLGFPLAVRSSASLEDGTECSFAGQFESFLNLQTLADVEVAVERCFASARSSGVEVYCRRLGLDDRAVRMAVIVQRMVAPELAGVAFTVNPTTGAEEVVIEACDGLADGLLAGRQTALPAEHPLLAKHRRQIEAVALSVQRHFGAPQDVEFAIENEILYVLQARPITRIEFAADIGEWTNANFRDGGVSSSVCSPLMWSLYDFIWDPTLKGCMREIRIFRGDFQAGRMFFGRPYWNLGAVKEAVSKVPGFSEREFDDDLSVSIQYTGAGRRTPVTLWTVLGAIPTILSLPGFFRRQERQARRLLAEFESLERRLDSAAEITAEGFRDLIERDYFRMESTYFRTIYAVSLAKLEFKRSFPDCDYGSLVSALPELRHMAPLRRMREMSTTTGRQGGKARRGESPCLPVPLSPCHLNSARRTCDLDSLVREFRHHCRFGIDVIHPRWDEDREFVSELLANVAPAGESNPQRAYLEARAASIANLPVWKRWVFSRKLDRLRRLVWLREELRDLSGRMYWQVRRQVLSLARQRGLGDDIFFQTYLEICDDDRREVEARRAVYESYRNFQAPHEIGCRFCHEVVPPSREHAGTLEGIAASTGAAEGTARLARNPQEALRAEPGSILVCPYTEPGWTTVLGRVAGVVTENGGQLSHAAVLCREFGIPAVLGVPQATQRIPDGSRVQIDGTAGRVTIVD